MQRSKKKLSFAGGIALVLVLLVMQLSSAIIALADGKTALKVSDFGDASLYAFIASKADPNNGGILYKEDAENITSLYFNYSDRETIEQIKSFANLSKYCPNIQYFSVSGSYINSEASKSLLEEINKLEKITNLSYDIDTRSIDNDTFSTIFNKAGKENITSFSLDISYYSSQNMEYDISGIANFTNLSYLNIYNSSENVKFVNGNKAIKGLNKLENVYVSYGYDSFDLQSFVDALPESVTCLSLSRNSWSSASTGATVDLSNAVNITELHLSRIGEIKGLDKLTKLTSIGISGITSSKKIPIDFNSLPASARNINLDNCDLGGVLNITSDRPELNYLYVESCELTEVNGLEHCPNLYSVYFTDNKLSAVPDMSKLSHVTTIRLSGNNITEIPDYMNGMSQIYTLNFANNKIKDISSLKGMANLSRLNVSCNEIESLPDMSAMTNLSGKDSGSSSSDAFLYDNSYRLTLKGNKLTEDAIKGKVPEENEKDKFFMYASTTRSTDNGQVYFPEINDEIISKWLSETSNTIYTSQKEFTLGSELVKYIKENKKYVNIAYVQDGIITENVQINAEKLTENCTQIPVAFSDINAGTDNKEVKEAFGNYGEIYKYMEITEAKTSGIDGVNYYRNGMNILDSNKDYNEYVYNKASKTFSYRTFYHNQSHVYNITASDSSYNVGDIRFFVEADKDNLVGNVEYRRQSSDGSYYITRTSYYKVVNDDVINGLINKKNGSTYASIYTTDGQISISSGVAAKLKDKKCTLYVDKFDLDSKSNVSRIYVNGSQINGDALKVAFPEVTELDESALSIKFAGGTPDKVYKTGKVSEKQNGVSVYKTFNYGDNVYTVYNGKAVPVITNSKSYNISLNADTEYFSINEEKDTYLKKQKIGDTTVTVATDIEDVVNNIINYNIDMNTFDTYNSYSTLGDGFTLKEETVNKIKNSNVSKMSVNVSFINSQNGKREAYCYIEPYAIKSYSKDNKTLEIKRPDVEVTTANEAFEKLLPEGTAALYLTNKTNNYGFINYTCFIDSSITDKLGEGPYTVLQIKNNGLSVKQTLQSGGSLYSLSTDTIALVRSVDYSTPSDTPNNTPSDTPSDNPSDKPSDDNTSTPDTPSDADGVNSAPSKVAEDEIVNTAEVNEKLEEKITSSSIVQVDITTKNEAPKLSSDVFKSVKDNQKIISVGVTDENNNLKYQWSFNSDTITDTNMDIDLSISFDTDRSEAVKEITGREDVMYISFAHHGQLPGPATIKTYVGNQYKNGEVIYLYYFNEEKNRVESVGGKGLTVKDGYVEYEITHCSLYFLSTAVASEINAVDPSIDDVPGGMGGSVQAGDISRVWIYVFETMAVVSALTAGVVISRRKEN